MSATAPDALPLLSSGCPDNASVLALSVASVVAAAYVTGDAFCFLVRSQGLRVAGSAAQGVVGHEAPRLATAIAAAAEALNRVAGSLEAADAPPRRPAARSLH